MGGDRWWTMWLGVVVGGASYMRPVVGGHLLWPKVVASCGLWSVDVVW